MARIKIEDLPEGKKIDKEEMKMVRGGVTFPLRYANVMNFYANATYYGNYSNLGTGTLTFHGPNCSCSSCRKSWP